MCVRCSEADERSDHPELDDSDPAGGEGKRADHAADGPGEKGLARRELSVRDSDRDQGELEDQIRGQLVHECGRGE